MGVSMEIKNSSVVYGSIAKWFHWLTALLILVTYGAIYYREWFAQSDFESWLTIQLHLSIGITLMVFVVLRIIWRLLNPLPVTQINNRLQYFLVKMSHFTLYVMMIIMPISGYLSIADYLSKGGQIDFLFVFDMTWFKGIDFENLIGMQPEKLETPAAIIHHFIGKWVMVIVLAIHIVAALYHHYILKDDTLLKITFTNSNTRRKTL